MQNNGYWPYFLNLAGSVSQAKWTKYIHSYKNEQKLVGCEMIIRFVAHTYPPCWVLKARIQKHRGKPPSLSR